MNRQEYLAIIEKAHDPLHESGCTECGAASAAVEQYIADLEGKNKCYDCGAKLDKGAVTRIGYCANCAPNHKETTLFAQVPAPSPPEAVDGPGDDLPL